MVSFRPTLMAKLETSSKNVTKDERGPNSKIECTLARGACTRFVSQMPLATCRMHAAICMPGMAPARCCFHLGGVCCKTCSLRWCAGALRMQLCQFSFAHATLCMQLSACMLQVACLACLLPLPLSSSLCDSFFLSAFCMSRETSVHNLHVSEFGPKSLLVTSLELTSSFAITRSSR